MRRFAAALALLIISLPWPLGAHDDRPAPVVRLQIASSGERLTVAADVPAVALAEANLPRTIDGVLTDAADGAPLDLVGRQIASDFDLQQRGVRVPPATVAARRGAEGTAVLLEIAYVIDPRAPAEIRLAPFRAPLGFVPIEAEHRSRGEALHVFRIDTAPVRVLLDPSMRDSARVLATQAARTLLDERLVALALLCLALPAIAAGWRRHEIVWFLAAEIAGLAVGYVVGPAPAARSAAMSLAAVVLVSLATSALTAPASRARRALAIAAGAASGMALGTTLGVRLAYAGDHGVIGLMAFLGVLLLGQWWLLLLLGALFDFVIRLGMPSRIVATGGAIYAGHEGLHAIADHVWPLSAPLGASPEHLLMAMTGAWVLVALLAAPLLSGEDAPDGREAHA